MYYTTDSTSLGSIYCKHWEINQPYFYGKLQQLFSFGQKYKKWKVYGDRTIENIFTELMGDDWSQYIDVTAPNIKAFFKLPYGK